VPEIATNGTRRAGARRLILLYMRSVRREWAKFGITCAAILAIAWLALNVTGNTLLTTGPLGDYHEPDEDSINEIADYVPGEQTALYFTADVDNSGPTAATIVRITPLGMTVPAAVQIVGSLPYNSDDPGEMNQDREDLILLGTQSDPGPAWANPQPNTGVSVEPKGSAQHGGRAFLIRISSDPTQETQVQGFAVEYTVGPFHFLTSTWGPSVYGIVMCPAAFPTGWGDNYSHPTGTKHCGPR